MYTIQILFPTKKVYLKEHYGSFYTYTPNLQEAQQWAQMDAAQSFMTTLELSPWERAQVVAVSSPEKYYVNPYTLKVEKVYTDQVYPGLFATLAEAIVHLDVVKETPDQYNPKENGQASPNSTEGEGDGTSGWINPDEE